MFDALINGLDFLLEGGFALLVRPFNKQLSTDSFDLAHSNFLEARTNLLSSVIFAVASILYCVNDSIKLLTRTSSSLLAPFAESEEEENNHCFSC